MTSQGLLAKYRDVFWRAVDTHKNLEEAEKEPVRKALPREEEGRNELAREFYLITKKFPRRVPEARCNKA